MDRNPSILVDEQAYFVDCRDSIHQLIFVEYLQVAHYWYMMGERKITHKLGMMMIKIGGVQPIFKLLP